MRGIQNLKALIKRKIYNRFKAKKFRLTKKLEV